jgi:hypothetical protein
MDRMKQLHEEFDLFTRDAPRPAVARALAAAFRSDRTPDFPDMAAQMFGWASAAQRASVLNVLLAAIGRTTMQVTTEAAQQVLPREVEALAREAELRDPSVLERISDLYAQQPQLLKVVGGEALAIALAKGTGRGLLEGDGSA